MNKNNLIAFDLEYFNDQRFIVSRLNNGHTLYAFSQETIDLIKSCFVEEVHSFFMIKPENDMISISFSPEHIQNIQNPDYKLKS